jgi:tetratricopeptide (TPR) repeat protein
MIAPRVILIGLAIAGLAAADTNRADLGRATELDRLGRSREALAAFMAAERADPDNPAILVKIAKQHGDLMTETADPKARRAAADESLAYSRRALLVAPRDSDANLAVAISLGKMLEFLGNRETIEASRKIKTHAETALSLNPNSDYAHHMLGRWHQGLAGVGGATRALAKLIYGGLPAASYSEALDHFAKARALRPDRMIHQIEYGRTLALMARPAEARSELAKGLAMPARDKDDAAAKLRGQAALDDL